MAFPQQSLPAGRQESVVFVLRIYGSTDSVQVGHRVLNTWLPSPGEPSPGVDGNPMPIAPDSHKCWFLGHEAMVLIFPTPRFWVGDDAMGHPKYIDYKHPDVQSYHGDEGIDNVLLQRLHADLTGPIPSISDPARVDFLTMHAARTLMMAGNTLTEDTLEAAECSHLRIAVRLYGPQAVEENRLERLLSLCKDAGLWCRGMVYYRQQHADDCMILKPINTRDHPSASVRCRD